MFTFFSKTKEPIKLWFTTDIHAHVLPGVDDGSPDTETSLQIVRGMHALGIRKILASPHIARDTFENSQAVLDNALVTLRGALDEADFHGVEIDRHSENRIDDLLTENLADGDAPGGNLRILPDNHILIENSFIQEPWDLDQLVFDISMRGLKPILAHPERYAYYHRNPKRYEELHTKMAFQVNVLSLAGYYGKHIKKMAEEMVEAGLVDFVGTDAHGMRHIRCFNEYLTTRDARRHARALEPMIQNHIFD